ncbi:hypothetical protein ACF3MZ_24470 [Paenibacillaceae bacterium WGS1546]|uniref:hypothetical protein n=1 Tax=Cohnella sp. WGS1546 TaxID=3366810 RepID=UPI00372D83FA
MGAGASRGMVAAVQAVAGALIAGIASGFVVWMASSWYGMELVNAGATWLLLWLIGTTFYLIQSSLLNWIGLPSMAILVLLMFFSMPLLNMAPESLSATTRNWIYSWTPLRFAADGLRETMYFGGLNAVGTSGTVLWSVAGAFLLLLLASGFKRSKAKEGSAETASPVAK